MTDDLNHRVAGPRSGLAAGGALAGVALYLLFEVLPELTGSAQLLTGLVTGTLAFFTVLLIALGPLSPARALAAAAMIAAPLAGLMVLASLRFHDIDNMLEAVHPVLAGFAIVVIATPFAIALHDPATRWSDYPALFSRAWEIVVRYTVAALFTATFWALYFLSSTVLELVRITLLERLVEIEAIPYVLSGAVLGLGLAVVYEQRHLIAPRLVLRLLRLALPPIVAVGLVFVLATGVQGLTTFFGGLSAGLTIMSMAVVLVTLITVTLDRDDSDAARAPVLAWSARIGAGLALVLAVLALVAVGLRVAQYGWTPPRVLASLGAVILTGYGLLYAAALLGGAQWRARIRRGNVAMALVTLGAAALWLTPVLDAERLSARSQLARFEAGRVEAGALDLAEIARDWGRPGARALAPYRDPEHPFHEALGPRLAAFDETRDAVMRPPESLSPEDLADRLVATLPVRPEGASIAEHVARLPPYLYYDIDRSCQTRRTPGGAPACVAILADFLPEEGDELLVLHHDGTRLVAVGEHGAWADLPDTPETIDRILAGGFTLAPARGRELRLGDDGFAAPAPPGAVPY